MNNLDDFFPINKLCHYTKCHNCNDCKKFHGENDVKIISATKNKIINNHTVEYNHSKRKINIEICPNRIKNIGYCDKGESCTKLHDEKDEITLVFHYNKNPIIKHKYCYTLIPILPPELWQIILKFYTIKIKKSNITLWPDLICKISKLSKSIFLGTKNLLIEYSNEQDQYFKYYLNECFEKVTTWENNNKIKLMVKDFNIYFPF